MSTAAIGRSYRDIRQALVAPRVQPWIQEAKCWFSCGEERIVDQGDDCGEVRRRSGRAADRGNVASPNDDIVIAVEDTLASLVLFTNSEVLTLARQRLGILVHLDCIDP